MAYRAYLADPRARAANAEADALGRAVNYTFKFDPHAKIRMTLIKAEVMEIEDTYALRREHKAETRRLRTRIA